MIKTQWCRAAGRIGLPEPRRRAATLPSRRLWGISFGPLSGVRNGNDLTLTGDLADATAKTSLLDAVKGALPGVNLIDNTNAKDGVTTPDPAGVGGVQSRLLRP